MISFWHINSCSIRSHKKENPSSKQSNLQFAIEKLTMGGIIDFSTSCPWQLYTFSFLHILVSFAFYAIDLCPFAFPKSSESCNESELVLQRVDALCLLYVGVLFAVLTFHNKASPGKINRLCTYASCGATAFLVSIIFAGNASFYGGIEKSWMHVGDMLASLFLLCIVGSRIDFANDWAQANDIGNGLGVNCKTLIILFLVICTMELFAFTDFVDPTIILADGLEMTEPARWMWNFASVLILDVILVLTFALFFEGDEGQELVISTVIVMSLIAAGSFMSVDEYMSARVSGVFLWVRVSIVIGVCAVAIICGRRGGSNRSGYQSV